MGGFVYASVEAGGAIYAGTDNGVFVSSSNGTGISWTLLALYGQQVLGVAADSTGNIYFAADSGVYAYNISSGNLTSLGLMQDEIISLTVDRSGAVYAGKL